MSNKLLLPTEIVYVGLHFELEFIFESNNVKLLIIDTKVGESVNNELVDDILSIIHVYSCRAMGKRRYVSQKQVNI